MAAGSLHWVAPRRVRWVYFLVFLRGFLVGSGPSRPLGGQEEEQG